MRAFKFFVNKIFLRKIVLCISVIFLMLFVNYTVFSSSRTLISSYQGSKQMQSMNPENSYVGMENVSDDEQDISEEKVQEVYKYLEKNCQYSMYHEGEMIHIPINNEITEIPITYINEEYYKLSNIELSKGKKLNFDFKFSKNTEIPVLVGNELAKDYPIGSKIKIKTGSFDKKIVLKVSGVLKKDFCYTNNRLFCSQEYQNFSIIFPVNRSVIKNANLDLLENGLYNLIILNTNKESANKVSKVIKDKLNINIEFMSREQNKAFFDDYLYSAIRFIGIIVGIILLITMSISIWNVIVSVRLMKKDFTISLLTGLSYSKLRKILYSFYTLMFSADTMIVFLIIFFDRKRAWHEKNSYGCIYGVLGLADKDWMALLIVIVVDVIVGTILVESMMYKIKKIPISLGVLQ